MLFKTSYNSLGELAILETILLNGNSGTYKCMVEDPLLVAILAT